LAKDAILGNQDWNGKEDMLSIVMLGLTNEIPEHEEAYELHRLLGTLLSKKLPPNEKLIIIETEYGIPVENEFGKDVTTMCNLSEGIVEEAREEMRVEMEAKIILNMHSHDFTVDQMALATGKTVDEVETILKENESVPV
jgi:hypothetical protein